MNLQDVTFKDVNVCSHAHHTSNFTCLMLASSTNCCAFVSFAVQHWVEHSLQCLYFKPRMSRSKHKSSSDVVCTGRKHLRLYCTTLLFQVLHCKIFKGFFLYFLMYCLCEKYYKPIIVQYYIADCVSWVPREFTVHGNTIFFFFFTEPD